MVTTSTGAHGSNGVNSQRLRTLANLLQHGQVTSEALVQHSIERMQQGGGNVFTQQYAEQALEQAAEIDQRRATGRETRQFAGIPISVKDLFDLQGQETWAGSNVLKGTAPALETAPAIASLLNAGLVIIGKTNMTEFAYSGLGINPHYGTPKNPCDASVHRIPGGSSSGSAVSVVNGAAVASIGTDTGGSVRIPSSLCGLTGFKPASNTIAKNGVVPLSRTLDTIGPLARSVQCCADLFSLMSQKPTRQLEMQDPQTIKLLVPTNCVWDECATETVESMENAMRVLTRAGVHLIHQELPVLNDILESGVQGCIAGYESWEWHRELLTEQFDAYDPRVSQRIIGGSQISTEQYQQAVALLPLFRSEFTDVLSSVDAVLYPTTALTAPPLASFDDDEEYARLNYLMLRNTAFGNVLDTAAISLPTQNPGAQNAGTELTRFDALPVGAMLMRPGGDEARLLDIAQSVEAILA